ncbi:MAG: hypothetical protein Q8L88_15605 [Bacteroidota bacterium]|nr:hypothetical protein [Bacteroidota bacterium]
MNKYLSNWIMVILVLLTIPPIVFSICYFNDIQFRQNLMAGLLSTLVGLVIGIPIALRLNHIQEKNDLTKKENEDIERKRRIIKIIQNELLFNNDRLVERQPNEQNAERIVTTETLKDELWNSLSDGGELRYINDPELLDLISKAYYYIRIIKYLEDKYFESIHFPGLMVKQGSPPNERILNYIKQTDPVVIKYIKTCIEKLESVMKQ